MSDLDKAKEEVLTQIGDWTAVGIPRDLFAEWLEPLEAAIRLDAEIAFGEMMIRMARGEV